MGVKVRMVSKPLFIASCYCLVFVCEHLQAYAALLWLELTISDYCMLHEIYVYMQICIMNIKSAINH